jgi:hypothetical protein
VKNLKKRYFYFSTFDDEKKKRIRKNCSDKNKVIEEEGGEVN